MALGLPFKSLSFNGRVECSGITTWVSLFQSVGLWNVLAARSGSNVSSRWRAADKKTLFIFRCLSFEVRHRHTNGHNFDEQRVKPVNVSQRESNYTFYSLTRRPDSETCYSHMTKHRFLFRQPCLCGKRVLQHCMCPKPKKVALVLIKSLVDNQ